MDLEETETELEILDKSQYLLAVVLDKEMSSIVRREAAEQIEMLFCTLSSKGQFRLISVLKDLAASSVLDDFDGAIKLSFNIPLVLKMLN
jgi:hypothetical protein